MSWFNSFGAPPLSPLLAADLVMLGVLTLAAPAYVLIDHRREKARHKRGEPTPLGVRYRQTMVELWALTSAVLAIWLAANRPWAELGLTWSLEPHFLIGFAAAIVVALGFASQILIVRLSPRAQAQVRRQMDSQPSVSRMMAQTPSDAMLYRCVAVTAGITEEILFRGFLIWGFAHAMPVWAAALLSLAVFTAVHLYQEKPAALFGVFVTGLVFTLPVLVTGSLLPAMVLHIVVDLANHEIVVAARGAQRSERDST